MSILFHWRTQEEKPAAKLATGLLAVRDPDDGGVYLLGIHAWREGEWRDEATDRPVTKAAYWWVPEEELLRGLR